MKHKELQQAIQQETGFSAAQVDSLMKEMVAAMTKMLSQGDTLSIQKFGIFEVKKKEERLSVNPVTGKRFMVPPKMTAVFRPGTTLKDKVKTYDGHES